MAYYTKNPWTLVEDDILITTYPKKGFVGVIEALLAIGSTKTLNSIKQRKLQLCVRLDPETRFAQTAQGRAAIAAATKKMWDNLSEEDRKTRAEKQEANRKPYTEQQRALAAARMQKISTERWASMSDDKKTEFAEKQKKAWATKTDSEKIAHAERTRVNSVSTWANYSDECREKRGNNISAGIHRANAVLSLEEFEARYVNNKTHLKKWWGKLSESDKDRYRAVWSSNLKRVSWGTLPHGESQKRRLFFSLNTRAGNANRSLEKSAQLRKTRSENMKNRWANATETEIEKMLSCAKGNSKWVQTQNGLFLPNKAESVIVNFQIPHMETTLSDHSFRVHLRHEDGRLWRKNPDFSYLWQGPKHNGRPLLVIEVMGFGRWHTKEEAQHVISEYQNLGIRCLVFSSREIHNRPMEIRAEILQAIAELSAK